MTASGSVVHLTSITVGFLAVVSARTVVHSVVVVKLGSIGLFGLLASTDSGNRDVRLDLDKSYTSICLELARHHSVLDRCKSVQEALEL